MAIKDWSTSFPTTQDPDPIQTNQPDLQNDPTATPSVLGDNTRVSQVMSLRNKVHWVAKMVGDLSNLPAGSLRARVTTLEGASGDATKLQGRNVASTAPSNGQALIWNTGGSQWAPASISGNATQLQGRNIDSAAPSDGSVLKWNAGSSFWGPAADLTFKTLQGAYDDSSNPVKIVLNGTRKGILVQDASPTLGSAETLWGVLDTAGTGTYFAVKGDGKVGIGTATPTVPLDVVGAAVFTGTVTAAEPTLSTHLATRNYVDNAINGLKWKTMVIAATSSANTDITLSGEQTIDGWPLVAGNRVLVKNQDSNQVNNGIYVVATGAWARAADMGTGSHAATVAVFIDHGTVNEDAAWVCTTDLPNDIVGTHALTFVKFSTVSIPVFTPGSVIVADATGALSQDNANFFWDNSSHRLGLGTTSPGTLLDMKGTLRLSGSSSGYVGLAPAADAGSVTYTLPSADGGGANYMLVTSGAGTLSWLQTVGVTHGGTGTTTQFTQGSIVFAGASGIYAQNNAKLTWDDTNFRLSVTGDLTVTGALGCYSYTAGETITQYQVVYAYYDSGTTSARIKKAIASAESSSRVIGVAVVGNTAGNAATVTMAGVYSMIFVDGAGTSYTTLTADFGKPVYLSQATAGAVTLVPPGAGYVLLRVGYLVGAGATASVSIHIGDEFQQ